MDSKGYRARKDAVRSLSRAWDELDKAKSLVQAVLREDSPEDFDELVKAVRDLQGIQYSLSGMRRTMETGFGRRVAGEILAVAKELLSMEFPTQGALDKYLKDHPDADRGNHKVVKTKRKPAKKEVPSLEREDVENAFRDHLSGTDRAVTKDSMKSVMKHQFKGLTDVGFDNVWNNLVKEEYLVPASGGQYKWEM